VETIRHLATTLGSRAAGSRSERLAADYIATELRHMGLAPSMRSFKLRGWRFNGEAELQVLSPAEHRMCIGGLPLPYTSATAPGGIRGSLVRHGEWPLIPGRLECRRYGIVDDAGRSQASVVVFPGGPARPLPNPEPLDVTPTLCIDHDDGCRVEAALDMAEGRVAAVLCCEGIWEGSLRSRNVSCTAGQTDRMLVLCAHMDSVDGSPGANDNASGVALLLRLARHYAGHPPGSIGLQFAFFGAEEPLFVGARIHVADSAARGELSTVAGCLNFDMVGVGERYSLRSCDSSVWRNAVSCCEMDVSRRPPAVDVVPMVAASDHWAFHEAGVDAAQLTTGPDPAYHTPGDVAARIDPGRIDAAESMARRVVDAAIELLS